MKFIFPKNYDFRTKLLGFIDYSTAIIDVIVLFILYFISTLLFSSLMYRITFLISLFLIRDFTISLIKIEYGVWVI